MKSKLILFAVCLLAGSLPAQGLFGGPPEPGQMPSRFILFEAASLGAVPPGLPASRIARVSCLLGRFRFGIAAIEDYSWMDMHYANVLLPVHVGYSIYTNPKKTLFCWGMVPDLYVEASGGPFRTGFLLRPMVRASLCADVDYYGVGLTLEGGYITIPKYYGIERERASGPYIGFRVRLLTFGIGF